VLFSHVGIIITVTVTRDSFAHVPLFISAIMKGLLLHKRASKQNSLGQKHIHSLTNDISSF
jgi:hypothetical protein